MRLDLYDILENTSYLKVYNKRNITINSITIDSRVPKDMFIGIKGENFDGSDFLLDVLKRGVRVCVVEKINDKRILEKYTKQPIIVVKDTKEFLLELASYKRSLYDIPVIAITGSAGKTTTKDFVHAVLSRSFWTLKTQDNMNNNLGVALTLLNLRKHECLVVEMGMDHYNEITPLSEACKPTISLITNIGTCHIENLGTKEDILKAKLEILDGMEKKKLVVNNDDELLNKYALEHDFVVTYGINNESDVTCEVLELNPENSVIKCNGMIISIPKPGIHNVYNALAAITIGLMLDIRMKLIRRAIESTKVTSGRSEVIRANGYKVISDCYNSNLEACKCAIKSLGLYNNRKIAVLGTIGELADYADLGHATLGEEVYNSNIDILLTVGEHTEYINKRAIELGFNIDNSYHFDNKLDAVNLLKKIIKKDDVILVKASHFNNFKYIVDELIK